MEKKNNQPRRLFSNSIKPNLSISVPTSSRDDFVKIPYICFPTVDVGKSAEILYKKPEKKGNIFFTNNLLESNNFVSDGGLKTKKTKFKKTKNSKKNSVISLTETIEKKTPYSSIQNKSSYKKELNKKFKSVKKLNYNEKDEKVIHDNKRINSLNYPKRKNNEYANIDEKESKYYQRTQPNLKFPLNSNLINSTFKNLNNNNNDIKIEKKKKNVENEEERNKLIEQLITDIEVRSIHDFQKKVKEEANLKEYKNIEEKINVLEKNGINVEEFIKEKEDNEENKEENKEKEEKEEKEINEYEDEFNEKVNDDNKNNKKDSKLKLRSTPLNNNYLNNTDLIKQRKPNVNYFEYEKLIKSYMKSNKDNLLKNTNSNNNSFRKSFESKDKEKGKIIKADSKTRLVYDDDSNFQLAFKDKINKRPKKEVINYMKKKDELRKENEIKKGEERKSQDFQKLKNLVKLQENINNNKKNIFNGGKNNNKVKNGFYIGKNKNLNDSQNNSQSTILDQNEYLINLIESKQIIVKGSKDNENGNDDLDIMSKEKYDDFIKQQEDKIRNGNLDFISDSNRKDAYDNYHINEDNINDNEKKREKKKKNEKEKKNESERETEKEKEKKEKEKKEKEKKEKEKKEKEKEKKEKEKKDKEKEKEKKEKEKKEKEKEKKEKEIEITEKETPKTKSTVQQTLQLQNTLQSKPEDEVNHKSDYQTQKLEEKIENLENVLKRINGKNVLNELILCDEKIKRYAIGCQQMIIICKANTFNTIRFYEHFIYYSVAFRQMCLPFIEKAFDKLRLYTYNHQKFSIFDQILEQNYKITFLKKVKNYIKAKEDYEKKVKMALEEEENENEKENYPKNEIIEDEDNDNNPKNEIIEDEDNLNNDNLNNKNRIEMEIKLKNAINTFENPIRSLVLQKIFEKAYKEPANDDNDDYYEEMNLHRKPFDIMKDDEEKDNKQSSLNDKEIKEKILPKQINEEKESLKSSDDKSSTIEKYIENDSNNDNNIKFKEFNEENNLTPKNEKEKNNQKELNSNNILLNINTPPSTEDNNKNYKRLESGSTIKSINELDISADKDQNAVDWEITIPPNKSSSERSKQNPSYDNSDNKKSNEKDNKTIRNIQKDFQDLDLNKNIDDNNKKDDTKIDSNKNNIIHKKEDDNKNDDNSYEYDFEDVDNFDDEKNDNILNEIQNEDNEKEKNNLENKSRNINEGDFIQEDIPEEIHDENKTDNINIIDNHSTDKKDNEKVSTIDLSNSFKYKDSSYNSIKNNRYNQEMNLDNKEIKNPEEEEEIIKVEEEKNSVINLPEMTNKQKNKLSDDLIEKIINDLLTTEIKNKKSILPKKTINTQLSISNSVNNSAIRSLGNSQNLEFNNTNNSIYSNQSEMSSLNNSVFMRPISEVQKDKTLSLYNEKIVPKLINKISEEVDKNYSNILKNIKQPFKIDESKLMNNILLKKENELVEQDLNNIYENKNLENHEFLNKNKIIKDFEPINKKIRKENNNEQENKYDTILNECLVDAANELIEKERNYGKIGQPLKWSIRNRNVDFKYGNDEISKKKFKHNISKQLRHLNNYKMALIPENYENIDLELINNDRDKKFYKSISEELKDDEDQWKNFEVGETKVKLILSKIILDQLLNEIVEILEHVYYSRKDPIKYQNKSIYACEDIPRLSFQNTTENNNNTNNEETRSDIDINI